MNRALLAVAFAAGTAASAQAVVYFDGVFNNADWALTLNINAGGVGSTGSGFQVLGGGNPNEYRRIRHSLNVSGGIGQLVTLHQNVTANYNPSSQGAITGLTYSEDSIAFAGPGNVQGGGMYIRQGGRDYIQRVPVFVMPLPTFSVWTTQTASLSASDFHEIDNAGNIFAGNNPDFSATGGVMGLGFWRGNSNFGSVQTDAGIDNWRVEIVPAPGAAALLGLGALAAGRRRR